MLNKQTEIRVRYADTDQMQFVYNGKYLEYFEVGRTEMLRSIGLPYFKIENEGYLLPVLEAYVKYLQPTYYDDMLIINSYLRDYPDLKIKINYEILRKENNEVIAEGFTVHAFIKKENKKISRPPEFFLSEIKKYFPKDV
jgi:acyl-CoA thioester hydrolase